MANLVRQEGDFTYWDDGAVRYAKGNSLGKSPGSLAERNGKYIEQATRTLAKRYPKHAKAILQGNGGHGLGKAFGTIGADVASGNETIRKQAAQAEAEAGLLRAGMSLSPLSPKLPAEAWGFIVEKQAEAAMSPDLVHSVRAAEFVGRATEYMQAEKAGTHIERMQVIVMDSETAELLTQRGGLLLPDVVEGEFREPTETGGASDAG